MLTALHLDIIYIIKMLLPGFEKVHEQLALLYPAVAKPGQQQLPDQLYQITEMILNRDEFHVSPNMHARTYRVCFYL